jgi:ribosomal protein L13E
VQANRSEACAEEDEAQRSSDQAEKQAIRRNNSMTEIIAKILKRDGKQRAGKGFSREELKQAGTNPKEALKLKIPIDLKRKTVHEENVATLRTFLSTHKAATKPKPKRKPKS